VANEQEEVRAFLRAHHMTQAELAMAAGVSQPVVSKALNHPTVRRGSARVRLFRYIQQATVRETPTRSSQSSDPLDRIAEYIDAIVAIIRDEKSRDATSASRMPK
jgi:transcriptional regulator with XRE-family HTH domain